MSLVIVSLNILRIDLKSLVIVKDCLFVVVLGVVCLTSVVICLSRLGIDFNSLVIVRDCLFVVALVVVCLTSVVKYLSKINCALLGGGSKGSRGSRGRGEKDLLLHLKNIQINLFTYLFQEFNRILSIFLNNYDDHLSGYDLPL